MSNERSLKVHTKCGCRTVTIPRCWIGFGILHALLALVAAYAIGVGHA